MLASIDLEPERNHIRSKLSAGQKFNSLLGPRPARNSLNLRPLLVHRL